MKYYMLRLMNHANGFSRSLFEKGYISIGYRDFDVIEDFKFIDKYQKAPSKEQYLKIIIKKAWNIDKIGSNWKIDKFFNFNIGDIILVPDSGCFYLVKVSSKIKSFEEIRKDFSEGESPDVGFVYKVDKIFEKGISRADFAGAKLTARLKNISGLLDISDLEKEIKEAIESFENNKPINLNEIIKEKLSIETLLQVKNNLNPDKFEKFLTQIMYKLGADTVDIPAKNIKKNTKIGIGDVDVVAVFEKIKHIIYIQAKFHDGETGTWALEQLTDYNDEEKEQEGYTQAFWAITTADKFSEEAIELSKNKDYKNIRLINGKDLGKLILDVGIEGI